jgi:hypothetical protein
MTTNSTELTPSREATRCPVTREFPNILWKLKNDHCVDKMTKCEALCDIQKLNINIKYDWYSDTKQNLLTKDTL